MIAIAYTVLFCGLGVQMIRWLMPKKSPPVRAWLGVSLGVLIGNMPSQALCANRWISRSPRTSRPSAAALLLGGGLLCRAGKSAAVRHAGIGQAGAGRDGPPWAFR